jgi:hypothetical protein
VPERRRNEQPNESDEKQHRHSVARDEFGGIVHRASLEKKRAGMLDFITPCRFYS